MRKKLTSIILALALLFTCAFAGVSEAAQAPSGASTPASIKSGDYMYYSVYNKIYKVNVNTKKSTLIYKNSDAWLFYDLTVKDGWIYCVMDTFQGTGGEYPYIFKVRTNGKDAKVLKKGRNPVVYNGSIYYLKETFSTSSWDYDNKVVGIYKMSLSGSSDKCIKKSSTINEFIVYKSNIYYTNSGTSSNYLRRIPLAGGTSKIMVSGSYIPENLKAYSDYIYFNYNNSIYKIKTTSTTKSKVASSVHMMDLASGYVYYTADKNSSCYLYRMKLSTKAKTYIMKNDLFISDVEVASGYMIVTYYYDPQGPYDNTAKYFCTTTGKSGKVLKTYFTS